MADPGMFSVRRQVSPPPMSQPYPLLSHLLTTRADFRTSKQQLVCDSNASLSHEALKLYQQHEPASIPSQPRAIEKRE